MSLKVLTKFPGGNAQVLQVTGSGDHSEVFFAADPTGGTEALWFCFRLTETAPEAPHPDKLTLTLCFTRNMAGFEQPAQCCPTYQPQGKNWFRTGVGLVRKRDDGQVDVSWQIPYPEPATEVVLCYPYGRNELDTLVKKSRDTWRTDIIGLTQEGRQIVRLSNGYGGTSNPHSGVFLLARQRAGETPGSWVLDGVLERLSREKKKDCMVWTVPFADSDGVATGRCGGGPSGQALTRSWGTPPTRHEAGVIQNDMRNWASRCNPMLVLDFQATGGTDVDGIYAEVPDQDAESDNHGDVVKWANVIGDALGKEFSASDRVRREPTAANSDSGTVIDFVRRELGTCGLVLRIPYTRCGDTLMTQKQYREAGRQIAKAILNRL